MGGMIEALGALGEKSSQTRMGRISCDGVRSARAFARALTPAIARALHG